MKRILAIILVILMLPTLASCKKGKYEPVPSTTEEARVVMTMKYGDRTYDVKYELYRALFLNYKSEVSGGDESVWSAENKDYYIDSINHMIKERIAHIYSVFALCDELGIDLYSSEADKIVEDYITDSIEGSATLEGYGSFDAYLEALKEMNLNYSVQDLLLRYSIGLDKINEYYLGDFTPDEIPLDIKFGDKTYTRDDIYNYYMSNRCVLTMRAVFDPEIDSKPLERAKAIREKMIEAAPSGDYAVALAIINNSGANIDVTEVENGYLIGLYSLDRFYYGEMTDAAFSLQEGDVSTPIEIHNGDEKNIYIIYRAEKTQERFENGYSDIVSVFLTDSVGGELSKVDTSLFASISYTATYDSIIHSSISIK